MAFTDPTRISVDATTRLRADVAFDELMAEHLRRAPWLGLSLLFHAIAIAVLWMWPAGPAPDTERFVAIEPPPPPVEIPDRPPEPVEPVEPDEAPDDPVLVDRELQDVAPVAEADFELPQTEFSDPDWNPIAGIGLAGGPPRKYGGRPGGPGGGRGRHHETTIAAALQWLRDHQDDDGRWDADEFMKHDAAGDLCTGPGNPVHDVGVTGLALLAFLGDGNTLRNGEHRDVVKRAVRWLRGQQHPDTGLFGAPTSNEFVYDHAIATLAMVEAYGLSEYRLLRDGAQRAISYLERHRNPYGAWRYQPRDGDEDTSVTGWCILAYKSAQDFGLDVSTTGLDAAAAFLDRMTDPDSGRTGYTERGGLSSRRPGSHAEHYPRAQGECMTAVSLFCRIFLGQDPREDPLLQKQAELLRNKPPSPERTHVDHYAWYYGTYALYQYGGRAWREWSRALTPAVVRTQRQDGNAKGSWDPSGVWGEDGGRVYSTAILTLTLQAYYRYARVLVR